MNRKIEYMIEYLIDLPVNRIEEVEQILRKAGIYFDQRNHMVAINEAFRDQSAMALGKQVPQMVESINAYLENRRLRPQIPQDHQDWDIYRYYRFLQFAMDQFSWNGSKVEEAWWQHDGRSWTEIAQEYWEIFRPTSTP